MASPRWMSKSSSSTNLSISMSSRSILSDSYPIKRSHSTSDLTDIYDSGSIYRNRPQNVKNYSDPKDQGWYYNLYYGSRYDPYQYFRTRRLTWYKEPTYTYYSYPRYRWSFLESTEPQSYRRNYYNLHDWYPYRWSVTPSYYGSKAYDYSSRAYNSYQPHYVTSALTPQYKYYYNYLY